jgi:hypothetical protein
MLLYGFQWSHVRPVWGGPFFNHAITLKKCFICLGIYVNKITLINAFGRGVEKIAGGRGENRTSLGISSS